VSDEEQEAGGTQQETGAPDPLTVGELITLAEAAEYAGLAHDTLINYVRRGRMKAKKMGPIWVTTYAAVDEYLASRSLDNIPKKYRNQS
jgi:excisionase family DNA binding protein